MIVIFVAVVVVVVAAFLGGLRRSSCQTQRRLSIVHMECHQIAPRTTQPAPHARYSASTTTIPLTGSPRCIVPAAGRPETIVRKTAHLKCAQIVAHARS